MNLPRNLAYNFFDHNKRKLAKHTTLSTNRLNKKFIFLTTKHNVNLNPLSNIDNSKWIINLSDKIIPNEVITILSLGDKFGLPITSNNRNDRMLVSLEIIKNLEVNQFKIPKELIETTRISIADSLEKFLCKNKHINHVDRFVNEGISRCNRFFRKNNDILVTKADKGQCTVILNKNDYVEKMECLLNDTTTYRKVTKTL